MLFKKQLSVQGARIRQGESLSVTSGDITVSITQTVYEHEDALPLLRLESLCDRTPPEDVCEWFLASLASGQLDAPPDSIWEYVGPLLAELHDACTRAFELLRWRTGSDTPHSPYASLGEYFSYDDGAAWHRFSGRGSVIGWHELGPPLSDRTQVEVQTLLDDPDLREPVAHALWREAEDSRHQNPRSAIVLGVSALETAIKGTIAELVPGSLWLVENMPSPPVTKLLKDYLPTLPVRLQANGVVHPPPKQARSLIWNAVEERNRIAHRGRISMGHREVMDFLDVVQATLYLLDYYRGHAWAWDLIDSEYRSALGT